MSSAKVWLLDQFQDCEEAIKKLWGSDKGSNATSYEAQQVELKVGPMNTEIDPGEPIRQNGPRQGVMHRTLNC